MAVPSTPSATATATVTVTASLYVGDLHPDVTDGQLFDAFSEFKSLASVRVCRDSSSGRSLCYGYVNFSSQQDAAGAIETKNHSAMHGKVIRVAWSHREPDARRSGIGNVFVKNLSESINSAGLQDLFCRFGNIISCKLAMSDDGKSKGYGFVQFETEDSATSAIESLNGSTVEGKQIYVAKFVKRSDRASPSSNGTYTNLYVKNIDPDVSEDLLWEKFSHFGKIVSLAIATDGNGASRGFGFVNFSNPDDARQALESINGLELGSKVLYVGRAQKKAEREQILRHQFEEKRNEQILKFKGSNVYVKNIEDDVSDEELREHFSQCGTVTSAKLMKDVKGKSKGFGFVCFSSPEEANKAVNTFHGYMFHCKPLYVAFAQRKEDRQAQMQLQYLHRMAGLARPSTAVMHGAYPFYYTASSGVIPQEPPQSGLMYHLSGLGPGWRATGFVPPTRPNFLPLQLPSRQHPHNRGRLNSNMSQVGGAHSASYMQRPTQSVTKDSSNQAKYVSNGCTHESSKGFVVSSTASNCMLSTLLAASANTEEQKQILGNHLYPLVQKQKPDLAAKITGMLLEMDNSELLLLLESPDSLAAKVEEAVQMLKIPKTNVSGQDTLHPNSVCRGCSQLHSNVVTRI